MMKKLILALCFHLFVASAISQSPADWQSDLRWLQQTVHSKYPNLFYNITAADWDKEVEKLSGNIPSFSNLQTLAGFIKLVALFHVGHTQVSTLALHVGNAQQDPQHNDNVQNSGDKVQHLILRRYPFQLYWFSDGLYIMRAENTYADGVGGKVLKIGNLTPEAALEAVRPLVSYENEQGFRSSGPLFLAIPEYLQTQQVTNSADEVPVTYSKNGKTSTVIFKATEFKTSGNALVTPNGWTDAKQPGATPLWQKEPTSFRYMEYLPESKTLFVRHSATLNDGNSTIADFFNKVVDYIEKNDVQKLILDIRMNGGGNNYLNKPIITGIIRSQKINQKGKFFCIIGRRTFSAAQNLVNELEKYTEVTFVGEPTAENVNFFGDTRTEVLPNTKLPINLSWMWWQNMDPRDKRKATSPLLAADMSFSDYYNNIDPAFKAVNAFEKMKPFFPTLSTLVKEGKIEEAFLFAKEYQKDPLNRYYADRLEANINDEAYRLMETNPALAGSYLEVNLKLFPASANAYDSYAESLLRQGKKEEALKYYQLAIEKDKDGATAENSKKMIEMIKKGH